MHSAPRVLHLTNMYPTESRPARGGFVAGQVQSLHDAGLEQDVLVLSDRGGALRYAKAIAGLRRAVGGGRYDLVHAHYGLSAWVACWQQHPVVATFAGSDLNGMSNVSTSRLLKGYIEQRMSWYAAGRASCNIVMSSRMRADLERRAGNRRVAVLPYGIDVDRFVPGDRDSARALHGLPKDAFVVLWPHSAYPGKRRDLAEAAMRIVRTVLPNALLWKPPTVSTAEMPLSYQAADCVPVLSDAEGSPMTVKEALSCCVPVVGVDVGDVWEWIGDVPWCRRVSRVPEDIARALLEIAQQARPSVRPPCVERFDRRTVAHRLVDIYLRVAGAQPRAGR